MDSMNCSIASLNNPKLDHKSGYGSRNRINASVEELTLSLKNKSETNKSQLSTQTEEMTYSKTQRILLTICLYLSFYSLGMLCNVLGPTLVHMSYLLGVDIATISFAFTFEWSGYLIGSLMCGAIYDHLNEEIQFAVFTLLMGATTVICPFAPTVHWFYALKAIQALTMGYVDAMAQAYVIGVWHGHRLKQAMHQTMMTVYSIGATTGPLFIAPFLVDLPKHDVTESEENSTVAVEYIDNCTADQELEIPGIENVRYSYSVVGGMAMVWSVFFFIAFFAMTPSCRRHKTRKVKNTSHDDCPDENKIFKRSMLLVIFLLTTFHTFIIIPGWISSFVIKGLYWDSKNGPLITSVYWLSNLVGRIVSIPISMVLSPGKMVTCYMTGTSFTLILSLAVAMYQPHLLWIAVALVGFTLATTFGTTVLWTSQHMRITGSVSSVLISGFSAGFMSAGALAGYLFQAYSPFWVLYLSILASFIQIVLFASANLLVKYFPQKRRESLELIVDE